MIPACCVCNPVSARSRILLNGLASILLGSLPGLMAGAVCGAACAVPAPVAALACQEAGAADPFQAVRERMVTMAIENAGVKDPKVLEVMRKTLRHEFIPQHLWSEAYIDGAVPIGDEQTISSPFIVAYMTESLDLQATDRVLEIGTGSGYQAAVLSPLCAEVYSIEIVEQLGLRARKTLDRLGYRNVFTKVGDGFLGWPEHAPFQKIIVTCSPEQVPQPLVDQLDEGGMIVIPVGERHQQSLVLLKKVNGQLEEHKLLPTFFVPMTGQAEADRKVKPDPGNPRIVNGNFDEGVDENGFVKGWYYERLLKFQPADEATGAGPHVMFENTVPGQNAHLMQGIAIDGRLVSKVELKGLIRYEDVEQGLTEWDRPFFALAFYDGNRRELARDYFGPFEGTRKAWKPLKKKIRVPLGTREAMIRIGMFGATGRVWFDELSLEKIE